MTGLLIAVHGTRSSAGVAVVREIADGVRGRLPGVRVEVGYADVRRPSVGEVLSTFGASVVVPAFLASGYHVRVDVPGQVAGRAVVTAALGPDPGLVSAARDRLVSAGWRGEPVVLAAAGSSDARARGEVELAGSRLAARLGVSVRVGYACGSPGIVVPHGWAVASWFLAPGVFHGVARASGASVVAGPLGAHPKVIDLVVSRYLESSPGPGPGSSPAGLLRSGS